MLPDQMCPKDFELLNAKLLKIRVYLYIYEFTIMLFYYIVLLQYITCIKLFLEYKNRSQ